jgi:hypothetical protein
VPERVGYSIEPVRVRAEYRQIVVGDLDVRQRPHGVDIAAAPELSPQAAPQPFLLTLPAPHAQVLVTHRSHLPKLD